MNNGKNIKGQGIFFFLFVFYICGFWLSGELRPLLASDWSAARLGGWIPPLARVSLTCYMLHASKETYSCWTNGRLSELSLKNATVKELPSRASTSTSYFHDILRRFHIVYKSQHPKVQYPKLFLSCYSALDSDSGGQTVRPFQSI